MILTGDEIIEYHNKGLIDVAPWDEKNVGTNSYDVTLANKVLVYKPLTPYLDVLLDPRKKNETEEIIIPENGMILHPGGFVLGSTAEYNTNKANDLIPMLEGRSSVARLGITVHSSAGFGDTGFCGNWTLEITVALPVKIYAGMPIAQIYWVKTSPNNRMYSGKYKGQFSKGAVASRMII